MPRSDTSLVYNAHWRAVRIQILERDGYRCQIRGSKCKGLATDVDHIVAWRDGGELYAPENLRAACAPCNRGRGWRDRKAPPPSREW